MLVEVWSDVVCPWCAVGKAQLDRALSEYERADEVEVRWRSFELAPERREVPDGDYAELLARKYGTTREQAQAMIDRMTDAGAQAGVEFRFDIAKPGNTFDAHRVLHLAAARGRQHDVKARLLAAYHSEGVPIADHGALTEQASQAGLDADEVREVLASDAYAEDVRRDERQAFQYGISGVPFFVFEQRVGLPGAQPSPHLLRAIRAQHAASDEEAATSERPAVDDAPPTEDAHAHDGGASSTEDAHAHDGHAHAPGEACVEGVCAI